MDELAAENEQLKEAIRRLAGQDATLSVCDGNVTVLIEDTDWIPVSGRFPADRQIVLAWRDKVVFGYRRDGQWIDTLYGWVIPNGPSHWMPLPSPPTE
jgi:hypothetical protein